MIAGVGSSEGEDCRGEEHGLVVGMGNEQTDALVLQLREARAHHVGHVHVQGWGEDKASGGDVDGGRHVGGRRGRIEGTESLEQLSRENEFREKSKAAKYKVHTINWWLEQGGTEYATLRWNSRRE